jgi:hypothetical protein
MEDRQRANDRTTTLISAAIQAQIDRLESLVSLPDIAEKACYMVKDNPTHLRRMLQEWDDKARPTLLYLVAAVLR